MMNKTNKINDIYRGIFWIIDRKCLANNNDYLCKIKTNEFGDVLESDYQLDSKNVDDYNHKITWQQLDGKLTKRKPFNFYPRGRISIKNSKCFIFINPLLNTKEIIGYLVDSYNLKSFADSNKLKVIEDYSEHYKCIG